VTESEAIVGASKRALDGEVENTRRSGDPGDLSKMNTRTILEQDEEIRGQEPGPELDPEGLKKAQEKANAGQSAVQQPEGALPPATTGR